MTKPPDQPDVRFVTRKWPPAVGGMETYCARITEELAKQASVEVIALPGRPCGRAPNILALAGFGLRAAARLLAARPARVVHVGDLASWPLAWIASVRHPDSRIVISAHGSDVSFGGRSGLRAAAYRKYLALGAGLLTKARVIANSTYVARLAQQSGFGQVTVVPLGTAMQGTPGRQRKGLLYAGRISRPKGLRFIVEEVLPLLPDDIRLRVAGPVWDEGERPLLTHPRVDYLGVLSPTALAAEYSTAAAALIPTRESEGFGLTAIEAAACGAHVIASAHSGLVDVVRPPIGVTVDANDPDEWADAIRRALAVSEPDRAAQADAALAEVESRFRWSRVMDATWAAYQID